MTEIKFEKPATRFGSEQKQPPWEDFTEKIDKNFKRKKPSSEAIKTMNERLEKLGEIFEGSGLNWHLDGALNISLMNGAGENPDKYIGEHKDVDISIEKNELYALETQLLKKGYGLFLSRVKEKIKGIIMKRISHEDFKDLNESETEHMLFAAIDKNGKIIQDKVLNFVDIHIIKRDKDNEPLGIYSTPIPEKWAQAQPMEFRGKQINISHPGKVLYYKIHEGRNYDITDAEKLIETGKITKKDFDDLECVYEDEFRSIVKRGRKIIENLVNQIKPEMNENEIFKVLQSQSEFQKHQDIIEELKKLAGEIAQAEDKSVDNILDIAINFFGAVEKKNKKIQELNKMRLKVGNTKELK